MHFPVGWDPYFEDVMTVRDVYHYPTQHYDHHRLAADPPPHRRRRLTNQASKALQLRDVGQLSMGRTPGTTSQAGRPLEPPNPTQGAALRLDPRRRSQDSAVLPDLPRRHEKQE